MKPPRTKHRRPKQRRRRRVEFFRAELLRAMVEGMDLAVGTKPTEEELAAAASRMNSRAAALRLAYPGSHRHIDRAVAALRRLADPPGDA